MRLSGYVSSRDFGFGLAMARASGDYRFELTAILGACVATLAFCRRFRRSSRTITRTRRVPPVR